MSPTLLTRDNTDVVPWRNSQSCGSRIYHFRLARRRGMVPLRGTEFCGPERVWQPGKGSGSKSAKKCSIHVTNTYITRTLLIKPTSILYSQGA